MESKFGAWDIKTRRYCSKANCKEIAEIYIGDNRTPNFRNNVYLCKTHATSLLNDLRERYGNIEMPPVKEKENLFTGEYIKLQYQNSGVTSKAKLVEFCKENNIELPDDVNMKGILKIMFPEVIEE